MEALVSVIIPIFNRSWCILRAVNSVLQQDYPNIEIIVIDDGSEDNIKKVLENLIKSKKIFFHSQKKQGVSAARNKGIKLATGKYIAFLDSDDEWLKNKISKQVSYLKKTTFKIVQSEEIWIRNDIYVNKPLKYNKQEGDLFQKSLQLCAVTPSSVIIEKDIFKEIGNFDENLKAAEDYDLWLRISCKYPIGLINENLIKKYAGHNDQLSNKHFLDYYRIMSLEKLLKTHLTSEQRQLAEKELARRKLIYEKGLKKKL